MNQSLSLTGEFIQEKVRNSKPSVSVSRPGRHVRYRHRYRIQPKRKFSNDRSRVVIHKSFGPPTNNRSAKENRSINTGHDLHSVRYFIYYLMCHLFVSVFQ
jgi:hypothetical protein